MATDTEQRLWTVDNYYRMAAAGILSEGERVELIAGRIMRMSPTDSQHAGCVMRLNTFFNQQLGGAALVNIQNPVRLNANSEPEPDVALLRPRADFYTSSHPTPADVLLLVEVADSSDHYDRYTKAPLYASAGIPEVWIVRLRHREVEVYSNPAPGGYQTVWQGRPGDTLTAQLLPQVRIPVAVLLP